MAQTEQVLLEVADLTERNLVHEAQIQLTSLIESMSTDELRRWEVDVRNAISKFLPKRRKQLLVVLDERLEAYRFDDVAALRKPAATDGPLGPSAPASIAYFKDELHKTLRELSEHYIFQWATQYRDMLLPALETSLDIASHPSNAAAVCRVLLEELSEHAQDIFGKGYRHLRQGLNSHDYAIMKSAAGLQRFLELPIEFYSAHLVREIQGVRAIALRLVVSTTILGVLIGYSKTQLGLQWGNENLERLSRSWAHYLAFLTGADLRELLDRLPAGVLKEQVERNILPLASALDELINGATDDKPLPILGQYFREQARLEFSIRPPPQSESPAPIDVMCFMDSSSVSRIALQEATNRNVAVVLADLRPDLREFVNANPALKAAFVATRDAAASTAVATREEIRNRLEYALYTKRSLLAAASTLTYNVAKGFPLGNPFLTQYFRVRRLSVARLLKTFERRNGLRLWCSVRRSGKTTACFDLGATAGERRVVSQTCDTTEPTPDSSLFYSAVKTALNEGRDLPDDFMQRTVASCASTQLGERLDRFVFVLDEYETLFGRLKVAAKKDLALRYTVVQPLLNQMVAFSRENLLVFLGQQPDAHFILMDQNQLSGAVEQDSFPLFVHGRTDARSEFTELVNRVLGERAVSHPSFVDALYEETSGHPFLTVKLLVDFVEWLIEQRRKIGELRFGAEDFSRFSSTRFQKQSIVSNPEYSFFREAVSQAIGRDGRDENVWLHCVYRIVRQIALDSPQSFTASRSDVGTFVETLQSSGVDMDANVAISTAAQANFLSVEGDLVRPKIRLLARIASFVRVPTKG